MPSPANPPSGGQWHQSPAGAFDTLFTRFVYEIGLPSVMLVS